MAFGYLQRMLFSLLCFDGFQRIGIQNVILIDQTVPKKFEHYMKMGHIRTNVYMDNKFHIVKSY